ncbi:MAG: hypothetical protein OXE40_06925 [Gammaproteobacteria bacterium]|nr:hypothetical protein [Gammaproteobacteria bacterium]
MPQQRAYVLDGNPGGQQCHRERVAQPVRVKALDPGMGRDSGEARSPALCARAALPLP